MIMAQGILPFKYESEKNTTGMTALAGLPVYLDFGHFSPLTFSIFNSSLKNYVVLFLCQLRNVL